MRVQIEPGAEIERRKEEGGKKEEEIIIKKDEIKEEEIKKEETIGGEVREEQKREESYDFSYPTFASVPYVGDIVTPPIEEIKPQRYVPSLREEGKLEDTYRVPLTQQILEKGEAFSEKLKQGGDFPVIKSSFMSADVGIVTKPIEEVREEAKKEQPIMASDVIKGASEYTAGFVGSFESIVAPVPSIPGIAIEYLLRGKSESKEFMEKHPKYFWGAFIGEVIQIGLPLNFLRIEPGKQLELDLLHLKSKIPGVKTIEEGVEKIVEGTKNIFKKPFEEVIEAFSKEGIAERTIFSQTDPLNAILLKQETEGMIPRKDIPIGYTTKEWKIVEKSPGVFDYDEVVYEKITRIYPIKEEKASQKGFQGRGLKSDFKDFYEGPKIEQKIEKVESIEKSIENPIGKSKAEQILIEKKDYNNINEIIQRTTSSYQQYEKMEIKTTTMKPIRTFESIEEIKPFTEIETFSSFEELEKRLEEKRLLRIEKIINEEIQREGRLIEEEERLIEKQRLEEQRLEEEQRLTENQKLKEIFLEKIFDESTLENSLKTINKLKDDLIQEGALTPRFIPRLPPIDKPTYPHIKTTFPKFEPFLNYTSFNYRMILRKYYGGRTWKEKVNLKEIEKFIRGGKKFSWLFST
ncbi:MAG: hypothetical protein ABIL37_01290 [candidate division WOR-3 bacterium]